MMRPRRAAVATALLAAPVLQTTAAPNWHGCMDSVSKSLPYCDTSLSREARLDDLMSRFNLTEKVRQITPQKTIGNECDAYTGGKPEIGLPPWHWLVETNTNIASGCPVEGHCATTFIGPMGLGASFNRSSWRLKGSVFGTEMRAFTNIGGSRYKPDGKNPICLTGFGPNINIARDPRFGRASELPGEDPFLSGTYAVEMVSGMQEKDSKGFPKMAAFLKHYTAYSRETDRGHDSYAISDFDFGDTYLAQYELAFTEVGAGRPYGVMCSYNAENGVPSCANNWLLNEKLRGWSPDALVTTDCGAVRNLKGTPVFAPDDIHAAAFALMNGTDIEMGGNEFGLLDQAVQQGLATEARITQAVRRSFKVHFDLGRFDPPESSDYANYGLEHVNSSLHQQISYEAALQGLVLLQNDGGALPLKQGVKVALLGPQGEAQDQLLSDYAADEQCFGGDYHCIITIKDALVSTNVGGQVVVAKGVEVADNSTAGIAEALEAAKASDVVVLAMGNGRAIEHEGQDRTDTKLPGIQEDFILQVLALNKPTVLVLTNGGAVAIDRLMERAQGQTAPYAIIEAFNPAVIGAKALAASLFGLENRWGKLPVTMYPHSYVQEQDMANYDMTVAPGRTYKYYNGTALYPFGYGLSLTSFALTCSQSEDAPMSVTCTVSNTGDLQGDEVVQVYHSAAHIGRVDHPVPSRALVDFSRVTVASHDQEELSFTITEEQLKIVNKQGVRTLYPGKHHIIFTRGVVDDEQVFVVDVKTGTAEIVV